MTDTVTTLLFLEKFILFIFCQMTESKLAKFVEDIIIPPRMVDIIVDSEVNLKLDFFYYIQYPGVVIS